MATHTVTAGSETVTTTEHFVASDSITPTYQTSKGETRLVLDLSDMVAGDELLIKFYSKVPTTARPMYQATLVGAQTELFVSPWLPANTAGWEWSLDCIAGTSIAITWDLHLIVA